MKRLSPKEKQVLELTAKGLKNKDIAKEMTNRKGDPLSEKSISTYIRRARQKLCVPLEKNTYFLVATAIHKGAISQPELEDFCEE